MLEKEIAILTLIAKVILFVGIIQVQIVHQVRQVVLIAANLLQMDMMNVAQATSAVQEKAIANPMMSVKVDLSAEPKTVPPLTQVTTIVV